MNMRKIGVRALGFIAAGQLLTGCVSASKPDVTAASPSTLNSKVTMLSASARPDAFIPEVSQSSLSGIQDVSRNLNVVQAWSSHVSVNCGISVTPGNTKPKFDPSFVSMSVTALQFIPPTHYYKFGETKIATYADSNPFLSKPQTSPRKLDAEPTNGTPLSWRVLVQVVTPNGDVVAKNCSATPRLGGGGATVNPTLLDKCEPALPLMTVERLTKQINVAASACETFVNKAPDLNIGDFTPVVQAGRSDELQRRNMEFRQMLQTLGVQ